MTRYLTTTTQKGTKEEEMAYEPISGEIEAAAKAALDCCFRVHTKLGPGLVEKIYESCLCYELNKAGVPHQRQLVLPIQYDDLVFNEGFAIDVLVQNSVVFELKSVTDLLPRHESQLMTYMKLSNNRLGFLINFNVARVKDGIKRRIL